MSTTGNRSNPNETRLQGKPGDSSRDPNRSDVAAAEPPDAKSAGGRTARPGGSHQETREHDKHNHPGQEGHYPQKHGRSEEKR